MPSFQEKKTFTSADLDQLLISDSGFEITNGVINIVPQLKGKKLALMEFYSPFLMQSIGTLIGKVHETLRTIMPSSHSSIENWDITQGVKILKKYKEELQDPDKRNLIAFFHHRFSNQTLSKLKAIRHQVIYGHINETNLFVSPDTLHFGMFQCTGIWGFDKMIYAPSINALANTLANLMHLHVNPLESCLPLIRAFHKTNPLTDDELSILFDLICIFVCLNLAHHAFDPQKENWALLQKLKSIPYTYAMARFRHICAFPICEKMAPTLAWIKNNPKVFEKPIDFDFSTEKYLIFDLSIASAEFTGYDWEGRKAISEHLLGRMKASNAKVGVTLYDEPRLFFTSNKYKVPNEDYEELRNVHLGMDFIMEEGTSVLAVLEGEVHYIIRNSPHKDLKNAVVIKHTPKEGISFFTIYGNITSHLEVGQKVDKGAKVGELVFIENWSPHLHLQLVLDLVGCDDNFPVTTSAEANLYAFWRTVSPNPNLILGLPEESLIVNRSPNSLENIPSDSEQLINKKHIYLVRSKEDWLYDENGKKYLNTLSHETIKHINQSKIVDMIGFQESQGVRNHILDYFQESLASLKQKYSFIKSIHTNGQNLEVEFLLNNLSLEDTRLTCQYILDRLKEKGILIRSVEHSIHFLEITPHNIRKKTNIDYFILKFDAVLREVLRLIA